MSKYHARQSGLVPTEKLEDLEVVVVGVGGIGSWAALSLAKLGVGSMCVIDPDIVEEHNLANQAYRHQDLTKNKVEALHEMLEDIRPTMPVLPFVGVFEQKYLEASVVVSGLDSMDARKGLWECLIQTDTPLYIDGRMAGEFMRIFIVEMKDPLSVKAYEDTLYANKEVSREPCSARSIVYNTQVIGGLISLLVKKYLVGEELPKELMFDLTNLLIITKDKEKKKEGGFEPKIEQVMEPAEESKAPVETKPHPLAAIFKDDIKNV